MREKRVGVVVLTHNRLAEVTRTLEHLRALPEEPPIVVVDNAGTDGTAESLAMRFPDVQLVRLEENLGAAGRNAGVEACSTPYVALCDDDTWWEPGSLAGAADLLDAHPTLGVVNASVYIGEKRRLDPTSDEMAQSPLVHLDGIPGHALLGFLAGASVLRRAAYLAVGGFDRRLFIGGEEELMALDLAAQGWAMTYMPELGIRHFPSALRDSRRRSQMLARNSLWTAWLRRPARVALWRTQQLSRASVHDTNIRAGLRAGARGMSWVLRERRVVPCELEQRLQLLEAWERGQPFKKNTQQHVVPMLATETARETAPPP